MGLISSLFVLTFSISVFAQNLGPISYTASEGKSTIASLLEFPQSPLQFQLLLPAPPQTQALQAQPQPISHLILLPPFTSQQASNQTQQVQAGQPPSQPEQAPAPSKIAKALEALLQSFSKDQNLEDRINAKVFGQTKLVKALVLASRVLDDKKSQKPKIIVITGLSGVGKSFVAEQVAIEKLNDSQMYLEIDGTKYSSADDKNAAILVHKLVGAEKAYQGSQKGELTEFLKRTGGKGVIVFNECEKMSPFIWTKLMEFFDKGVISSGADESIEGKNTLIILTSNRGSRQLIPESSRSWTEEQMNSYIESVRSEDVRKVFSTKQKADDQNLIPEEVLNRVTDFLLAAPLSKTALKQMLNASIKNENSKLAAQYPGLQFDFSQEALDYLGSVQVDWNSHGRMMNQRGEKIFVELTSEIIKALTSGHWTPESINQILIDIEKQGTGKFFLSINNDMRIEAPQEKEKNPLASPLTLNILTNLKNKLSERVIGQEDMIERLHQDVLNHLAQGYRERATVLMLIGTTGTGKTEAGRAIAESVYGDTERASVIDMGELLSNYQFSQKFEQGIDGSESDFEVFLRSNPDGGVLIMDEVSNMGGQNIAAKNELFKKLYGKLDRRTWKSPVTGKEYDLSKYIIVMTGNDGEQLFIGSSADEDRLEIWKENNKKDIILELLRNAGIPEAFLARVSDIILTKPLLRKELKPIAEKLIKEKIAPLEKQFPGIKIQYSEGLVESLSEDFFAHGQGVRSIREVVDKRLGSCIFLSLINSGYDLTNLSNLLVSLDIEDNKELKPYKRKNSPKRQVNLIVNLSLQNQENQENQENQVDLELTKQEASQESNQELKQKSLAWSKHEKYNLTDFAVEQVLMRFDEALLTAIHEAGHAVANIPEVTGEKVSFITIRGGTWGQGSEKVKYLGYARTKTVDGYTSPDRQLLVARIARIAAGAVAEELAGNVRSAGWSNDLKKIRVYAQKTLIEFGLDDGFLGVQVDKEGNPILSDLKRREFEVKLDALIRESINLARSSLSQNWRFVRSVAAELMRKGEIDGTRFEEIGAKIKEIRNKENLAKIIDTKEENKSIKNNGQNKNHKNKQEEGPKKVLAPQKFEYKDYPKSCSILFK